jgi:hypothetical protein
MCSIEAPYHPHTDSNNILATSSLNQKIHWANIDPGIDKRQWSQMVNQMVIFPVTGNPEVSKSKTRLMTLVGQKEIIS